MKIDRLRAAGFALSRNDRKVILYGQPLTTLATTRDAAKFAALVDGELARDRAIVIGRLKGYQSWALQKIPAGEVLGR